MLLLSWLALLFSPQAEAFVINVMGADGGAVGAFRWLVEEDNTNAVTPGAARAGDLGISLHKSHAPVVASGDQSNTRVNLPAGKRYFVSVLPSSGYGMGGAPVAAGEVSVNVRLQPLPMPTAQITVQVFEDISPINMEHDVPLESGLAGFSVILDDTVGTVIKDAFGNPLGTTYQQDALGNFLLDANGKPVVLAGGSGVITSGPCPGATCGFAQIKYLMPGKYGIRVVPPTGQGWVQTNTIEGTKTIDAWVKPNEQAFFVENGPPGRHAFFGFVRPFHDGVTLNGGTTVSGRIVNMHQGRPPYFSFAAGHPIAGCWVGLNSLAVGVGRGVHAAPCAPDGTFSIPGVPAGDWELAIWDDNLHLIFGQQNITVTASGGCKQGPNGSCALGDVPVFNWFARLENRVFFDANGNGFPDAGEAGLSGQGINLRFRDGSLYQKLATDIQGNAPFEEVFPFFKFLVAEVDTTRFKATGLTSVTDAGGAIPADAGWAMPSGGKLNPQQQLEMNPLSPRYRQPLLNPYTGNSLARTRARGLVTQAFQSFLGTTNVIQWGKNAYLPGENGGIRGTVYYAATRAANDPALDIAEKWEPGIPRVQVNLYQDSNGDAIIDDLNGNGVVDLADVDNYPLGNFPGPEDLDRNGNRLFDAGDALQIVHTDSFDDTPPTGCQGAAGTQAPYFVNGNPALTAQDCADGLRTYNQVRDGVYDGRYAFTSYFPGGKGSGSAEVQGLPAGTYIVESAIPAGYQLVKEEDRNIDIGAALTPSPLALPPACVGDPHLVPATLSLFPGLPAPFAGQTRPLCDRKQIILTDGLNANADFFLFTFVPKASRIVGFALNDLGAEFDPANPNFGEKPGAAWIPISIRDYAGAEITRVHADQWGNYNALVPSTFTMNAPTPSGISPNMLRVCLNDPGPVIDPRTGMKVIDPYYQSRYSRFCYTFEFTPGKTNYLDTPIIPTSAFTTGIDHPLDCEFADKTPVIHSVSGPVGGPYVRRGGETITIAALGAADVPNPDYDAKLGTPRTVRRDYGFGQTKGKVTIGGYTVPDSAVSWGDRSISVVVPAVATSGQLTVTRGDNGLSSVTGVTLTIGGTAPTHVVPGMSIQAAVDAAAPGDLILVAPGTYDEKVILWKPIRLQGWGAGSTFLTDAVDPTASVLAWRTRMAAIVATGAIDLVPGQQAAFGTEEGAGITVVAPAPGRAGEFTTAQRARIDGFDITSAGASSGGGIFVSGYAHGLEISNNRIHSNQGIYGGGIRVGGPTIADSFNDNLAIHHNQVLFNGTTFGAGGGLALYGGSHGYRVSGNHICGNFSASDGGGIGHTGLSDGGVIDRNQVIFNESFMQLGSASGGGLFISGGAAAGGTGAGSVTVSNNVIAGNHAGAGDGGGVRVQNFNGAEVGGAPLDPTRWYRLTLTGNLITNNVAGMAAGGISLQDVARSEMVNNTIANNDTTATVSLAFVAGVNTSTPQPAGVVSRAHSAQLMALLAGGSGPEYAPFSNPRFVDNIVWNNRSFLWDKGFGNYGGLRQVSLAEGDLAVVGVKGRLDPRFCLLTNATGYHPSNRTGDPQFVAPYLNRGKAGLAGAEFTTALSSAIVFDEGGNAIKVAFSPLSPKGNYRLDQGSPAIDSGSAEPVAGDDLDGHPRNLDGDGDGKGATDMGAYESSKPVPGGVTPPSVEGESGKSGGGGGADPLLLIASLVAALAVRRRSQNGANAGGGRPGEREPRHRAGRWKRVALKPCGSIHRRVWGGAKRGAVAVKGEARGGQGRGTPSSSDGDERYGPGPDPSPSPGQRERWGAGLQGRRITGAQGGVQ